MQTAVISYRVADFLKQHPPFQYMEEADLVGLAARGRVKFHESDEFLIWQGAAHGANVLVIQQGTVSIWEEPAGAKNGDECAANGDILRDMRGTGDLLGIERFAGADKALYSAKSTSDVVVYAFPASEFAALVAKYPAAAQYLAAAASVGTEYQTPEQRRAADEVFLYDVVRGKQQETCLASATIREAVISLRASGRDAIGILDEQQQLSGVLTSSRVLQWIAEGGTDASRPVADLVRGIPSVESGNPLDYSVIALDSPVSECVLKMASENTTVAALTERGQASGRFHGLVTASELAPVFGEQPPLLLQEIRGAQDFDALRELNQRVRAFLTENLQRQASIDWLARFAHFADTRIVERVLHLTRDRVPIGARHGNYCWCFAGAAGRRESLTLAAPGVVLLVNGDTGPFASWFQSIAPALEQCGYLPQIPEAGLASAGEPFGCAAIEEWEQRFAGWLEDPVQNDVYLARPMFDLLPVHGNRDLYARLAARVSAGVTQKFLYLLANDCLSNLPPLTFFRDAVVSGSGEQSDVFDLDHTALTPLVDVGRVFGLAAVRALTASRSLEASAVAGSILGASTLDRFASAKTLLPDHESIFREASETLRTVLFHQARVGIRQRSSGAELPPALLSRHDRQVLKSGFRSILKLLEFTAECQWLERL